MRFTVDSNVLFYAVDDRTTDHRDIASDILVRGRGLDLVLSSQVLGEFLNAVRRKNPSELAKAITLVEDWSLLIPVLWTGPEHIIRGAETSRQHKLQFWDSVIIEVAREGKASIMLTEDMQDGATIRGVTTINPFNPANRGRLDELLAR